MSHHSTYKDHEGNEHELDPEMEKKRELWKREQARLRSLLKKYDDFQFKGMPTFIGGVDISFYKGTNKAVSCLIVCRYPSMEKVAELYLPCIMTEPYMPGFLGFREVGHIKDVIELFTTRHPEAKGNMVIMVDGNGILHYRGFGSASHLGVVIDIPTIGVGKELLVVDGMVKDDIMYECETKLRQFGDTVDLVGPNSGRLYGRAMRSTSAEEPIYVSIGHKISLETAVTLVKACCKHGSLLPEPVRLADGLSRDYISDTKAGKPARSNKFYLPVGAATASPAKSNVPPSKTWVKKEDGGSSLNSAHFPSLGESTKGNADQPAKKKKVDSNSGSGKGGATITSNNGSSKPEEIITEMVPKSTKWNCPCGAVVSDSISCPFCRHINM